MAKRGKANGTDHGWAFLSRHGLVLACLAADPGVTQTALAARVGLSVRAARAVLADLARAGYVTAARAGGRVRYTVVRGKRPNGFS